MRWSNKNRLDRIAAIIEQVDVRCMAGDGPVTPTLQEMTEDELRRIYRLSKGQTETEDAGKRKSSSFTAGQRTDG